MRKTCPDIVDDCLLVLTDGRRTELEQVALEEKVGCLHDNKMNQ